MSSQLLQYFVFASRRRSNPEWHFIRRSSWIASPTARKDGLLLFIFLLPGLTAHALSGPAYLEKFNTYRQWCQQLPSVPNADLLAFIAEPSPLTKKLREKWLYQLAQNKDWEHYSQYYQPSNDINLQCYAQFAAYQRGQQAQAIAASKTLWLSGTSQPPACNALFNLLLAHHDIPDELIQQRINLALEKRNVSLARYLLNQYRQPQKQEALLLSAIHRQPTLILQLTKSPLHQQFYLYGLKQLVLRNMPQAIAYWQKPMTRYFLTEAQQQSFIIYLAQYKAMRNQPDAASWFAQIKPAFATPTITDWQIRYALAHHHWTQVIQLISKIPHEEPAWQYWLARAHQALHQTEKATELYQKIAPKRNYYGFLASVKLNQQPHFENETPMTDVSILQSYQPLLNEIQTLYLQRQTLTAARLLNDFSLELPKDEKSALAYWVATHLQWHDRAIYLSSNEQLTNQLALRFPLAYEQPIMTYAKRYSISPVLVYAMIRQESSFRNDIISSAGANGLMQIMPLTAKVVAKSAHISYRDPKELYHWQNNIHIGIAYLQQLAKQFRAHPLLMAAAYNAGPKQVNFWLKNHPMNDIDIWIETLPWQETRNYLKNIIAFYAVYQYRLRQSPNVAIFLQPF